MKIVRTDSSFSNSHLKCKVDSVDDYFSLKKRIQENSRGYDQIIFKNFQSVISISPELAIKINDENSLEIAINYLQCEWNLDELKYVFYNRPELFSIDSFLLNGINHIDDDFARDILDRYHKERPYLLSTFIKNRWLSPEVIVESIDKYKWYDEWETFLKCYTELGDDFLEKHWDEDIKNGDFTQEASANQKMSLEFMIKHEEDINFTSYILINKHITKEIFLHYIDKWKDDEIFNLFIIRNVIPITADIADIVMPICFKKASINSLIRYINDGQCTKENVVKYVKELKKFDGDRSYYLASLEPSEYTKYILTELKDRICWESIYTYKLEEACGDISWLWDLIPDEYYNNIECWNLSWLQSMPIDRLLSACKKNNISPFMISGTLGIYNRPRSEVLKVKEAFPEGFSYVLFADWTVDNDINYIRENKYKILHELFTRYTANPSRSIIFKMIENDIITVEDFPSLNSDINANILLKHGACFDGVLRFITNYGDDKTYKAIDLIKDYIVTKGHHKDALENINYSDVNWFVNEFFFDSELPVRKIEIQWRDK